MPADDLARDGEANPRARHAERRGGVAAHEFVEDAGPLRVRNADTPVAHADGDAAVADASDTQIVRHAGEYFMALSSRFQSTQASASRSTLARAALACPSTTMS